MSAREADAAVDADEDEEEEEEEEEEADGADDAACVAPAEAGCDCARPADSERSRISITTVFIGGAIARRASLIYTWA